MGARRPTQYAGLQPGAGLTATRDGLNEYAAALHEPQLPSGLTPFQLIGHIARLTREGQAPVCFRIGDPARWTADAFRERTALLEELAARVERMGPPTQHPWHGVAIAHLLPQDAQRLTDRISALALALKDLRSATAHLSATLDQAGPVTFAELDLLSSAAEALASSPLLESQALLSADWRDESEKIEQLLQTGTSHAKLAAEAAQVLTPAARSLPSEAVRGVHASLIELPVATTPAQLAIGTSLHLSLKDLVATAAELQAFLKLTSGTPTLRTTAHLSVLAELVLAAPRDAGSVLESTLWETQLEQASGIAEAAASLSKARALIGTQLSDAAWTVDLSPQRQILAAQGDSFFRYFSGAWRAANRLVRSYVADPKADLASVLALLDALDRGRRAVAQLDAASALAVQLFSNHWLGERSNPEMLKALTDWVRSLLVLPIEERRHLRSLCASGVGVSSMFQAASRLKDASREVERALNLLSPVLSCKRFGLNIAPEDAMLSRLIEISAELSCAEELCHDAFLQHGSLSLAERIEQLVLIETLDATEQELYAGTSLGNSVFGSQWTQASSDWTSLRTAAEWMHAHPELIAVAARNGGTQEEREAYVQPARALLQSRMALLPELESLLAGLNFSSILLGNAQSLLLPITTVAERLALWVEHAELLSTWIGYRERCAKAEALDLGEFVDALARGAIAPAKLIPSFEMAYFEALLQSMVQAWPQLASFDGQLQTQLVDSFTRLDLKRISQAAVEVALAHHGRIPHGSGGIGPLGVLRGEMAKRSRHLPLRKLMHAAGPAVQALKPVMMMSPLSVAQFLPPGEINFDLLVMDEASQIQPVDALGSIARANQIVVVGDERQLPPTKFFSNMTSGAADDEDDLAQAADVESILGLCCARGLPQRMLRWHYRSRHQSLIAVSNSQFYENKLIIVPSPQTVAAGTGLRFHHIPRGVFDSGGSGANAIEASAVAEAVMRHALEHPELSLGVATFSVRQRRAIQDELERLRRLNPETEPFFAAHPTEPFFLKNLENVQGDERDVIFISVGYGRSPTGAFAMRFGPLGTDGGERRLNVLISRAKRRCDVFSSITDEDIDTGRARGAGVAAFKLFLRFARTGNLDARPFAADSALQSPFEHEVQAALEHAGYQVHRHVGISGIFIDLAIADPAIPGRYILGIECDGQTYRSARSARDRDRLRRAVLQDHGWLLHRIWSPDWLHRPKQQLELAIAAIERAKAIATDAGLAASTTRAVAFSIVTADIPNASGIVRETSVTVSSNSAPNLTGTEPPAAPGNPAYVEATPACPTLGIDLHLAPRKILADLVCEVVATEGPIHTEELTARVRTAWGLLRSGQRIQAAVDLAIQVALETNRLQQHGDFLSTLPLDPTTILPRNRSAVVSPGLRRPEMIAPVEIEAAILTVIRASLGARPEELTQAVSRLFGFRSTSAQLRALIELCIQALGQRHELVLQSGLYLLPKTGA